MKLHRVLTLFGKELTHTPKSFFFVWAFGTPLLMTLLVSLVFGNLFSSKPKLGVMDSGQSEIITHIKDVEFIRTREYDSLEKMKEDVTTGRSDLGVFFPAGFDDDLRRGESTRLTVFIWGESMLKSRSILFATLSELLLQLAGREDAVEMETVSVGSEETQSISQRMMPLLVLLAIVMGGMIIPSSSLVQEKERRTLRALTVTPASLGEIYASKALLGITVCLLSGVLILLLNRGFGTRPLLLLLSMCLGAVFSSSIGLLMGTAAKDIAFLLTVMKSVMLLLYAPGILKLFPRVPDWIGRIFPTHYIFSPVIKVSMEGGTWRGVAVDLSILAGLAALTAILATFFARSRQARAM